MFRLIAAAAGGLIAGAAAVWLLSPDAQPPNADTVVRDIVAVPTMLAADAEVHRNTGYADIHTIVEVQSLPTPFARLEALYALAGRSGSERLQGLIFDANRVADDVERQDMQLVLFYRLAEVDPQSALAMARTEYFRGVMMIERIVWRAWSRKDLDDALFAAKTQTTVARQNMAAQSLYAAYGFMGNEITDRIESELGIAPDRSNRARYLYQLANRSPAEAVRFIESFPYGMERGEYVSWLAHHFMLVDSTTAAAYADLFEDTDVGEVYRGIVASNAARANPVATIDRILASGRLREESSEFYSAMNVLASEDLGLVEQYFHQVTSTREKQWVASIIAEHMVRRDPQEALAWARANDVGSELHLEMTILSQIARNDPELALVEAQRATNVHARDDLIMTVVHQMAHGDPEKAVSFLEQIADRSQRDQAASQIASRWLQKDPEAALDWILSNDDQAAERLLMSSAYALVGSDVDAAIRVLPRISGTQKTNLRMQIALRLAQSGSATEAQAFVRQFANEPDYKQLQMSVIQGVAQTNRTLARQMAEQLTTPQARDAAYARIVGQFAQDDPRTAAAMLASMTDERLIATASAEVATSWYNVDPAAANRWVASLPVGPQRDAAVMQMAGAWREPTREQLAMIDAIVDDDKRGQAKLRRVYNLMHSDPERARQLLEDPDIPNHAREQVEMRLHSFGTRY
ncbi:MAG: hypothetical protein KJO76_08415 [Gammaproteobacteria bacterium]|nr:hypothetical protein [Gammaproteobacteria bacterium]